MFPCAEDDDDGGVEVSKDNLQAVIKNLNLKIDELNACYEQISKQGRSLQSLIVELEGLNIPAEANSRAKTVVERATLFRLTSSALLNVSSVHCLIASY